MNPSISRMAVRDQLAAMGCAQFDLGVLLPTGRMLLREGWSADQIGAAFNWLRHQNARGAHIFIRPCGVHGLSLIDDLNSDAIARMKGSGFQPAVIVETSPSNFQVWLNHGRTFGKKLGTQAAKELARRFGGDRSSADWRHFGRLAGFTNQKESRRLANGLPPFVRLRESSGRVYDAADVFHSQIAELEAALAARQQQRRPSASLVGEGSILPLAAFHRDPHYGGDLHRADMAWALYAAGHGVPEAQIKSEILYARDLSKKGGTARQRGYAKRTAAKALAATSPMRS
ncbi:MAG TPA: DNA-primase RepB domain-containing protein [Candidatus Binataceae bacterium]|nr:DNA-primase RepB domain-containing protein [Candidatus Binataceae bacterium]